MEYKRVRGYVGGQRDGTSMHQTLLSIPPPGVLQVITLISVKTTTSYKFLIRKRATSVLPGFLCFRCFVGDRLRALLSFTMHGCQNTNYGDNDRYDEQENENLPQSENKSPVKTCSSIVFPGFCIEIFRNFKGFLAVEWLQIEHCTDLNL